MPISEAELNDSLSRLFAGGSSPPTSAPSDGPAVPIADPTAMAPEVKARSNRADTATSNDLDFLGSVLAKRPAMEAEHVKKLEAISSARDSVTDQILNETQGYQQTVAPILQKSQAIADKQAELAAMNPFKRFFVSMSSLDNNPQWLEEQQQALKNQAAAHTTAYSSLMGLHKNIIDALNEHQSNADTVFQAQEHSDESVAAAHAAYVGAADHAVSESMNSIENNSRVLQASALQSQDTLGKMTLQETTKALAQATANGGSVLFNGVKLDAAELQKSQMEWKQKNLSLASMDLSVKSGQLALAREHEQNAVEHMTLPELNALALNGGRDAQGRQFNMQIVGSALASAKGVQQYSLSQIDAAQGVTAYQQKMNLIGTNNRQTNQRAQDMFGVIPPALQQHGAALASTITAIDHGYRQAFESGGADAARSYIQAKQPELDRLLKSQDDIRESMVKTWAGGHTNIQALGEGYLKGQNVSAVVAAAGLIEMVHFGVNPGKLTKESAATLSKVKQVVADYYSKKDQTFSVGQRFGSPNAKKGEVDEALLTQVIPLLQSGFSQDTNTSILRGTPTMAAGLKDSNGKPLNAGRINPMDLAQSIHFGDEQGINQAAKELRQGLDGQTLKSIVLGGPNSAIYKNYAQAKGSKALPWGQLASTVQNHQTQLMLDHLRSTPSGQLGFDPAHAMVEAWQHPDFQSMGMRYAQGKGGQSIGDFATHSVASGQFGVTFLNQADAMAHAATAVDNNVGAQKYEAWSKLRNTGMVSAAQMAIHSFPGLNAQQANILNSATLEKAQQVVDSTHVPLEQAIGTVITSGQFEDPMVESLRKKVAGSWGKHYDLFSAGVQGFLAARMSGTLASNVDHPMNGEPEPTYQPK